MGGIRQHLLGDAVDARHVGHRIHHADVGRPDIGLHVARGDGRYHHLGNADRQPAHCHGRQRRAARAAGRDQAAEVAPRHDEALEGDGHLRHGRTAVAGEHRPLAVGMMARNLARRHRRRRRRTRRRQIDGHRAQAELLQAIAQKTQFAAFGVERAGDVGGPPERGRHGQFHDAGLAPGRGQGSRRDLERWRRRGRLRPAADDLVARAHAGVGGIPACQSADRALLGHWRRRRRLRHRILVGRPPNREDARFSLRRHGLVDRRLVAVLGVGACRHAQQPLLQVGIGGQLGRRHDPRDAAIDHHRHRVGHIDRHTEILLDQQDRQRIVAQRLQRLRHLLDDHRRQPLGRLVHHQQAGIEQKRAADRQHLLLAAGELEAAVAAPLGQAREKLVDALDRP